MLSSLTVLWPAGQQGTRRCALLGSGAPSARIPRGWFLCGYSEKMNRTRCLGHSEELVGTGAGVAAAAAPPARAGGLDPADGMDGSVCSTSVLTQDGANQHGQAWWWWSVRCFDFVCPCPSAPASVGDRPHSSHAATDTSAGFSLSQSPCSAFWTGGDRVGSSPERVTETPGDCCFCPLGPPSQSTLG